VPTLSCRDLGGDCDFVAAGKEPEEVKKTMLAHMRQSHGERSSRMSPDERDALDVRIDQVLRKR